MKTPQQKSNSGKNSLDEIIVEAIHGHFYGSGKGPGEMRDEYYRSNTTYRKREDALAEHLKRLGAEGIWRRHMHARVGRKNSDSILSLLPRASEWPCFSQVKETGYIPKGAEEEEQPEGRHLPIELMTEDELRRSAAFDNRQARAITEKAQNKLEVIKYRKVMGVPSGTSLKDWFDHLSDKKWQAMTVA